LRIFLQEALVLPESGLEFHLVFPPVAHAKATLPCKLSAPPGRPQQVLTEIISSSYRPHRFSEFRQSPSFPIAIY
jgi:hypothetical protein